MGMNLKNKRIQMNLTLSELSKKTGLSTTYISNLENGRKGNPSRETMIELANALNCSVNELFFASNK